MNDPHTTSAVRVFGKSMHVLAAGWLVSIAWLWLTQIQLYEQRVGLAPSRYAVETLAGGILPAALVAMAALSVERWAGKAPTPTVQRREWWHAFWWSIVPNVMLLMSVWVMIQEAR